MTRVIEVIRRGRRGGDGASNLIDVIPTATNLTLTNADSGKAILCTAALTLTLPATVTTGWSIIVDAEGGDVTIDASATINGGASLVVTQGNSALVYFTGSVYYARFYVASAINSVTANSVGFSPITGNAATNVQAAIQVLTSLWNAVTTYGKSLIAAVDAPTAVNLLGSGSAFYEDFTDNDDLTVAPTHVPARSNVAAAVAAIPRWKYISALTAITTSSATTFTHGLASPPTDVCVEFECTIANNGYAVGDKLLMPATGGHRGGQFGYNVCVDANGTDLVFSLGVNITITNKTAVGEVSLGSTNWQYRIKATN